MHFKSTTMKRFIAALAVTFFTFASSTLHAQIIWTGATSNTWLDTGNWSGGDGIPNANTEVAQFTTVQTNNAPNLGSATTIAQLQFLTGAGSYTLSGSTLSILSTNTSVDVITHTAGNVQTINNALALTASGVGSRRITVGAGSTLNTAAISATGGSDTSINLAVAGTFNLGGAFAGNQLSNSGTGVVNINANQNAGTFISNNPAGRVNWNANLTGGRTMNLGNTTSSSGRGFVTTAGVSLASVVFRGANGVTNTFGADIGGAGGTGSVVNITSHDSLRTNATWILSSATDNILNVTGVISAGASTGTKFQVEGPGVVRFSGTTNNTSTIPVTVNTGRLELNKSDGVNALASTSAQINSGAELRLLNNNQIVNTADIAVSGGTFNLQSFSENIGILSMTSGAITGSGTLSGTAYNIESGSISANLGGAGALTKTTAGTLTVTGSSSYSGTTDINAGTFVANNTVGSATGQGSVTVSSTATLAGHGRVETGVNNLIMVNGTLMAGTLADTEGMSFELATSGMGSTVLGATSSTLMDLWSTTGTDQTAIQAAADTLRIFGSLDIMSGASLTLNNPNSLSFAAGDLFQLIDWSSLTSLTGTWSSIDSSALALGGGLVLDTSNLYSTGVIGIVAVPEPSRVALLLLALLPIGLQRSRRSWFH
jgi:autotransporter-associated beta strand protein